MLWSKRNETVSANSPAVFQDLIQMVSGLVQMVGGVIQMVGGLIQMVGSVIQMVGGLIQMVADLKAMYKMVRSKRIVRIEFLNLVSRILSLVPCRFV